MFSIETVGFIAGTLTTIAFVPQVYKTIKTKSAEDVSIFMFLIFSIGVSLWVVFGLKQNQPPIYITNSVVFVLAVIQIILKIKYDYLKRK